MIRIRVFFLSVRDTNKMFKKVKKKDKKKRKRKLNPDDIHHFLQNFFISSCTRASIKSYWHDVVERIMEGRIVKITRILFHRTYAGLVNFGDDSINTLYFINSRCFLSFFIAKKKFIAFFFIEFHDRILNEKTKKKKEQKENPIDRNV